MRRLFLTIGNVLIYCVNLAVSLGCDLLDNVTMVKHGLILTTRRRTSARQLTLSGVYATLRLLFARSERKAQTCAKQI